MGSSPRWTRLVAIGVVVVVAVGGSLVTALSLATGDDAPSPAAPAPPAVPGRSALVLPQSPLGWTQVTDETAEAARRRAEAIGRSVGAQTLYAEYAGDRSTLTFTGIVPDGGSELGRSLAADPDTAVSQQFTDAGMGKGKPYRSGVPGVALRCGEPRKGQQSCVWADGAALALLAWRLAEGGQGEAARLTAALIPTFRQAGTD